MRGPKLQAQKAESGESFLQRGPQGPPPHQLKCLGECCNLSQLGLGGVAILFFYLKITPGWPNKSLETVSPLKYENASDFHHVMGGCESRTRCVRLGRTASLLKPEEINLTDVTHL